jgi:hypothetical protein
MNEELKSFLFEVSKIFFRFGIKSVTMADIARELGISKKTIYTKVEDKTDLVSKVMDYQLALDIEVVERVANSASNAIDEMFDVCNAIGEIIGEMHPSVMYDLQKYYPQVYKRFSDHKETFVLKTVVTNLKKGKEQGLFRPEFNEEIIAKLHISKMDLIWDPKVFDHSKISFIDVVGEMMIYHIYGVSSEKGREYLNKRLNKN